MLNKEIFKKKLRNIARNIFINFIKVQKITKFHIQSLSFLLKFIFVNLRYIKKKLHYK